MSGRFHATGSFYEASKDLFVVHGEIVDGVAHAGQYVTSDTDFAARVHGVELMRLPDGHEDLALTFLPPDGAQADAWRRLPLADCVLELSEIPPS